MTIDNTEIFGILDKYWNNNKYRKKFNKNRNRYIGYLEKIYSNKITEVLPTLSSIETSVNNRKIASLNVLGKMHNLKLINQPNIVLALMHMFCNRLSRDAISEELSHSLLRNTLYSILEKSKHHK